MSSTEIRRYGSTMLRAPRAVTSALAFSCERRRWCSPMSAARSDCMRGGRRAVYRSSTSSTTPVTWYGRLVAREVRGAGAAGPGVPAPSTSPEPRRDLPRAAFVGGADFAELDQQQNVIYGFQCAADDQRPPERGEAEHIASQDR